MTKSLGGRVVLIVDQAEQIEASAQRAARAAGFAIVCVPYGYNHGNDIRDSGPDLVVNELTELAQLFDRELK